MVRALSIRSSIRASRSLVVVAALGVIAPVAAAAPTVPTIVASRTSGVAPLSVHFDATATTDPAHPRPFHSLLYAWNFGESDAGTWRSSGLGKNQAFGAVAGHLFTKPGSYTVTLTVTNPVGQSTTRTIAITVQAPNDFFPALSTWCYANTGTPGGAGFEDCPVRQASQHIVTREFGGSAVTSRVRTNTRHLLRRGDTFTQPAGLGGTASGPILIASFGPTSRAKPVLTSAFRSQAVRAFEGRNDWRVGELTLVGDGGIAISRPADSRVMVSNPTFWDINATGFSNCGEFNNIGGPTVGFHQHIAVVDFTCTQLDADTAAGWTFFDRSDGSMFLGLEIGGGGGRSEGLFRTVHAYKTVLQHSRLYGNTSHGALAVRSCGQDNGVSCVNGGVPNQFVIVSDNWITEGVGNPIRTCTHDECDQTGSEGNQSIDMLWERNFLTVNFPNSNSYLGGYFWIQGGDQTFRNNVADVTGLAPGSHFVLVSNGNSPTDNGSLQRNNLWVFNNTVFLTGAAYSADACAAQLGSGHICRNNLIYAPGTNRKTGATGSGWTASNNLRDGIDYQGFPFATPYRGRNNSRMADFKLLSANGAIGAGFDYATTTNQAIYADAELRCKREGQRWDVGAYEFDSIACPFAGGPLPPPADLEPPLVLDPR